MFDLDFFVVTSWPALPDRPMLVRWKDAKGKFRTAAKFETKHLFLAREEAEAAAAAPPDPAERRAEHILGPGRSWQVHHLACKGEYAGREWSRTVYKLALGEHHVRPVLAALELLARLGMGQFDHVAEALEWSLGMEPLGERESRREERALDHVAAPPRERADAGEAVRDALRALRELYIDLPRGCCRGIHSPDTPRTAKLAWEVQQVLRKAVAVRENHDRCSVWHGPVSTCSGLPLPRASFAATGGGEAASDPAGTVDAPPATARPAPVGGESVAGGRDRGGDPEDARCDGSF